MVESPKVTLPLKHEDHAAQPLVCVCVCVCVTIFIWLMAQTDAEDDQKMWSSPGMSEHFDFRALDHLLKALNGSAIEVYPCV